VINFAKQCSDSGIFILSRQDGSGGTKAVLHEFLRIAIHWGSERVRVRVEFNPSFDDFLAARGELQAMVDDRGTPFFLPRTLWLLFIIASLVIWDLLSLVILSSGLLMVFAATIGRNFLKQRARRVHLATLRADYEQFSSGPCTFEADDNGWRYSSIRDKQVHSWDEVQMVRDHPRILYLMTHSGACTLPKAAFTPCQLEQVKLWVERAMNSPGSSYGSPDSSASGILCKFGFQGKNWEQIPHEYGGVWATEKTTGPNRLVIAPASGHVNLLLKISRPMSEPFSLLYILVSPHGAASEGRYESSHFLSREDLVLFLKRFGPFLESDGRHHFWIRSIAESDLLVYDNHNLIYAYGCLDRFKEILNGEGLVEVPKVVIPYPHTHFLHEEFDGEQDQLLSFCEWEHSPLQDED
jgi:hypothetical protein